MKRWFPALFGHLKSCHMWAKRTSIHRLEPDSVAWDLFLKVSAKLDVGLAYAEAHAMWCGSLGSLSKKATRP